MTCTGDEVGPILNQFKETQFVALAMRRQGSIRGAAKSTPMLFSFLQIAP
jgi:hypothetical protein